MADFPHSVSSGDDLPNDATTWNAILAVAHAWRQGWRPKDAGGGRELGWGGVIQVKALNSTGDHLDEYKPAALTDAGGIDVSGSDPDDDGGPPWQRTPLYTLEAPSSSTGPVAVTLEAIPDGEIGWVAIAGGVLCDVNLGSGGTANFARPVVGGTDFLEKALAGPIRVLVVPAGEGSTKRCVVMIGGCCDGGVRRPLGMPCLVTDTYGAVVGIAQRWVNADGSVDCEVSGVCGDDGGGCGAESVPPPPPPPPPPVDPPDDPPETYSIFVTVTECPGLTPSGFPYTAGVADSVEVSQPVPAEGVWFSGIPWGTDTAAVLTYAGGAPVANAVGTVGCSGSTAFGTGLTATVNGSSCEHMAVAFTIGGCSVTFPPTTLDAIELEPPVPLPPPP